jgi:hypothetical protein
MPKKKGKFLCSISSSYEGELRNKGCVCKKVAIFMVRETPFNSKALRIPIQIN